jgi:hypothetical protein
MIGGAIDQKNQKREAQAVEKVTVWRWPPV